MRQQHYDIIGDIHGCYDKLVALLDKLEYQKIDGIYRHPEGRKVAFLGDFIDPKGGVPYDVPAVLNTVKDMVDDDQAVAIMGNHEFNAVAYATPDGNGGYLRPHETRNRVQGSKSYEGLDGGFEGAVWNRWIDWFKTLPMFLELDGLRLVHAFWKQDAIDELKQMENRYGSQLLQNHEFIVKANTKGEHEYNLIEWVLKGLEVDLPKGEFYHDHQQIKRVKFRAKWFDNEPKGKGIADLTFPFGSFEIGNEALADSELEKFPGYPEGLAPVFFGHYFKPEDASLLPELPNLACLDYSVAKGGPMVAYRWDGEQILNPEKYVTT